MPIAAGIYYFAHEPENYTRPPVILIHGAGGTHLHWPAEMRRLNQQRVFALDLPGHGKSEGIGRQSVEEYALSVVEFMKAMQLRAAVCVGHSMGSAISMTLALKYPKRVLGLGLVGSGARLRVASQILENAANPATFPVAVEIVVDWSYSNRADSRLKELAARRMAETRPTVFHADFLACNAFDVMDKLGRIRVPTFIVCGAEDRLTPVRYAEYLRDKIDGAQLSVLERAGHMVMLERPAATAAVLENFLQQIPYQSGL
jgi:pimeloyl-ACP methyl ester carboxylesterase